MNKTIIVGICGLIAFVLWNDAPRSPVVASTTPPRSAAKFDFGDVPFSAAPDKTTPVKPFSATPPRPMTIIDSADDVTQDKVSAFGDLPPYEEAPKLAERSVPTPIEEARGSVQPSAFTPQPSAFTPQAAAYGGVAIEKHTFQVQTSFGGGTAIAIRPDTLLTANHVARHGNARLGVNGAWMPANVQQVANADDIYRDAAILRVPNGQFPTMNFRAPKYYEPVTVYGFVTQSIQRGIISAARTVSLAPSNIGIKSGDSGGAVVADDGSLVGILVGDDHVGIPAINAPRNPCVLYFTPLDVFMPHLSRAMQGTASGNNTWDNQPSIFDPPTPVSPNNQQGGNCAVQQVQRYTVRYRQPVITQFSYSSPNCANGVCQANSGAMVYRSRRGFFRARIR